MQLKEQAKERERKRKEEKVLNQLNHVTADKFIYLHVSFCSPFHAELITCRITSEKMPSTRLFHIGIVKPVFGIISVFAL